MRGKGEIISRELDVDVVLDPASLGYALGAIIPVATHTEHHRQPKRKQRGAGYDGHKDKEDVPPLVKPSLVGLVKMFERRGMKIRHLTVVVPSVAVRLGRTSEPTNARARAQDWSQWIDGETSAISDQTACELRTLRGAFDGLREVGVDELVAWATLDRAVASDSGDQQDRPIVVVSADSDMWDLHEWAAPKRVFVAARFNSDQRGQLKKKKIPFIFLDPAGLMTVAPGQLQLEVGQPVLTRLTGDHQLRKAWGAADIGDLILLGKETGSGVVLNGKWSTPLNKCGEAALPLRTHFPDVGTISIVDPYGMRNQALRAIGVARFPRAATIRSVLEKLHFPGPIAVHSVIPDLTRNHGYEALPDLVRQAWGDRDSELDKLAKELTEDSDDTTHVRRASVRAERMGKLLKKRTKVGYPHQAQDKMLLQAQDRWRLVAEGMIKRLSTNLIAELWNAVHFGADQCVVLVSEDPDVYWALSQIREHDPRMKRVVRVGLHARRAIPLAAREQVDPTPFVVLTEWLIAELCDVHHHRFARSHREQLAEAVHEGDEWTVVGIDPESGGIRVRREDTVVGSGPTGESSHEASNPDQDPPDVVALESLLHPGEVAINDDLTSILEGIGTSQVRFDLLFDPDRTCSVPQLRLTNRHPTEEGAYVIARDGDHLHVDVDGDGSPDRAVSVGHDTTRHPAGERIVLRKLQGAGHGWVLGDPGPAPADGDHHLEIVDLAAVSQNPEGSTFATGPEGRETQVFPVPGGPGLQGVGRIIASRLFDPDTEISALLALSSRLEHLDPLPQRTAPSLTPHSEHEGASGDPTQV